MVTPLNQCTTCGEDFVSLRAFDEHVLSASSDPDFDCLQVVQMKRVGWTQDGSRRWTSPRTAARAAKARQHFHREAA